MGHPAAHEEAAIPGKHNAAFRGGNLDDVGIVVVVAIAGIESEEAKEPRQRSQVHVQDEAGTPEGLRPHPAGRRNVQALEDRVDRNAVAFPHSIVEIHRLSVHDDEIHLGVGNPVRLDHILDRGIADEGSGYWLFVGVFGKEAVELFVESNRRCSHDSY